MGQLVVISLTNEYRTNPLGTDVPEPRLSWQLQSERRGTLQRAYRLQVTDQQPDFEQPLWDTGMVASEQSIQVVYAGRALASRTRYFWRVKVWDNEGVESAWSETAWWETAFLTSDEWQAQWITPAASAIEPLAEPAFLLRRPFEVKAGRIASARVYATAAGVYDLYLNGDRVGDAFLAPGWTSYRHRLQYQSYEVTDRLAEGANMIGLAVADGWYKGELTWEEKREHYGNRRAVLLQLHVTYEDGTEQIVLSDETWQAATGPIRFSELYHGEIYDARLEQPDWCKAQDDAAGWAPVEQAVPPSGVLVAQENWPSRVIETIRPIALIRTPAGETVLDMGQNMVGRIRFEVEAPSGTEIRLRHAEVLDRNGNFYTGNLRHARQTLVYTAKGEGTESYAPHFTFQGFRYVQIEGYPEQALDGVMERFVGEVIHTDMPQSGDFQCSSALVNQLQHNIRWGQRGNFLDVPTDCPQRDERLGWTGDAQVFIRTAAFNYHIGPFFTKWVRDLKADQKADGGVPFVIPDVLDEKSHSSAAWGDAAVICPWTLYLVYDDKRLLAEQFDSMKAWVAYQREQGANEYLWNTGFHFGDWLGMDAKEGSYIGATPRDLIATAFYAHSVRLVRDAAVVLNRADDVRTYAQLLERVVAAFREEFVTPAGRLAAPTQTAHVLALMFELVEGDTRTRVARDLNQLVLDQELHLTTGFVGTPYLCFVLSDNGYHDTAVKLLLQESYPSWLYSVNQGATTIWEHWDGIKPDGSFWSDDMNSYNHYAYGAIGDWLYRTVAGLDMASHEAGYRRLSIHPRFAGGALTSAKATYTSLYGPTASGWTEEAGKRQVEVTIPANATAQILLPGATLSDLQEGGKSVAEAVGLSEVSVLPDGVLLTAGSGTYVFSYSF